MSGATGEATLPSPYLQNKAARELLTQRLVPAFTARGARILALKTLWLNQPAEAVQDTWNQILPLRVAMDDMVKSVQGVQFFVSCITASAPSKKPKAGTPGSKYLIRPAIGYWLVSEDQTFNDRDLFNRMNKNPYGAIMKLALQPFQTDEKAVSNALCNVVKDNWEGLVRRMVAASKALHPNFSSADQFSILKVFVSQSSPEIVNFVTDACNKLQQVAFPLTLEIF